MINAANRTEVISMVVKALNGDSNIIRDRNKASTCWRQTMLPRAQKENKLTGYLKAKKRKLRKISSLHNSKQKRDQQFADKTLSPSISKLHLTPSMGYS